MRTIVIGCNHRTAPIAVRERLAFDDDACAAALRVIGQRYPCCESAILSTCNRTELYIARPSHGRPRVREAIEMLVGLRDVPLSQIENSFYQFVDTHAVRHLFTVASSLDSLVVGESQILGQAKKALRMAQERSSVGNWLTALFQRAFAVAKQVHTATGIAAGRVSVGSTAVDFARQIFASFEDKTVLMIGAGKMAELTLQHLAETRPQRILVTNRTPAKAEELARRMHGEAVPFDRLADHLAQADIVLSSTGSPEPILGRADLEAAMARRRYRPMILLDIAVPRDIDSDAGDLEHVFLYNVDDLQQIIEATREKRQAAVAKAQEMIEVSVQEFAAWQSRRGIGPVVQALEQRLTDIGEQELAWVRPKLSQLGPRDEELLRQMLHRLTRKIMHGPTRALNKRAGTGEAKEYSDTLKTLFDLSDEP